MVNGWVYGYQPACRQDSLERAWFTSDYLKLFDLFCVQTEAIKQKLVASGAEEKKVIVTGNMKFDSLGDKSTRTRDMAGEILLKNISEPDVDVIVAGCLINAEEYQLIIESFIKVIEKKPNCKLVIAPRHPEKPEQIQIIVSLLNQAGISYILRSKFAHAENFDAQVIVLDTFGELKAFYSIATVCYVGRDHNVLEPLTFGKPVVVPTSWHDQYPSYPVYDITRKKEIIYPVNKHELVDRLEWFLTGKNANNENQIAALLGDLSGATEKIVSLVVDSSCS